MIRYSNALPPGYEPQQITAAYYRQIPRQATRPMDWTRDDDKRFTEDVRRKRAGLPRLNWTKTAADWSKRDPVPGFNPNAPRPPFQQPRPETSILPDEPRDEDVPF